MLDLDCVERELKKRLRYPYRWENIQTDKWDKQTRFIYHIQTFDELLDRLKNEPIPRKIKWYAMNRWYNFWSAQAVETMFALHDSVKPNPDKYDKNWDFEINGKLKFDHKTSIFPRGYRKSFRAATANKKALLWWLYKHQSQQGRKHLENRLFLVLYERRNHEHWKLKADFSVLKREIDGYLRNYSEQNLLKLHLNGSLTYTDIIWVVK